jgi:hypothetical protein
MANFLKKVGRRMERDLGIRNRGGIINKGNGPGSDPNAAPDKGPQFTDAARQQAAGAGTVGFTQRTQNW